MKSLTGKVFLLALVFTFILCCLHAIEKSNGNQKFRLIHSDKLFLSTTNQENVLQLFGNVHFFYGKTEFFSNQAFIFDEKKIARLMGTVKVSNDTLRMTADSVSYYRIPDRLDLIGNVVITEQKDEGVFNRFTCSKGTYDKANDVITASKKVTAYSQSEKARAKSNYAYWDRKNGYGYLIDQPELWSEDKDTLYIRSEKMEFFDADHKIIATFNVNASSKDYNATSDFLLYFLKEDKAIFQGEPRFTSDFADAIAKEFYLYFQDRKLTGAELKDSCQVWFAEDKGKPKTNWVKADFVSMNLDNDYLKAFQAESQISYFYEQEKQEKRDFFSNDAVGEFLTATFQEDGKLESMRMKQKVEGIYRFENQPSE